MSSGEADAYTFTVNSNTTPINDWWTPSTTTWTTGTSYIYMYQITCPRCEHLNWGQVDQIITCKGERQARNNKRVSCGARIKAVLDTVDYEVPVANP